MTVELPTTPLPALFIGGTGRCGTTATNIHIRQHPDIYGIQKESQYLPYDKFYNPRWVRLWKAHCRQALLDDKKWITEKSPGNCLIIHELLGMDPRNKYLHITRNFEATVKTMMRGGRKYPIPNLGIPKNPDECRLHIRWVNKIAENALDHFGPERMRIERVEDLKTEDIWAWMGLE